jgi:hypothetical protein
LAIIIHYLIFLLIIIMAIGFGYWILLMAIDYFEIQFLELEFGFSKVKY